MVYSIKLCDVIIKVKTLYDRFYVNFKDYVYSLKNNEIPQISIEINKADIEFEKKHDGILNDYDIKTSEQHLESLAVYRKIAESMPFFNTFLMHGLVLALHNKGYMFVAPSGTGKSTRAKIWLEEYPDSIIVNGDKPLIKIEQEKAIAFGTPWCGKENYNNNSGVALHAIYLLERADGVLDTINEISISEAFPILYQQVYQPQNEEAMCKTLQLFLLLIRKVKIYKLKCSPSNKAIRLAYETANS